ncbi:hypothetical protein [Abyssisolibacter fermentans]|uniref:hypothetical protein n=1 Tax=Abyssisolibacter fermentans TaxID=1766203 RepID=UPI0008315716|nr:hypothetical protein [Abyssisolibacter fermentans]
MVEKKNSSSQNVESDFQYENEELDNIESKVEEEKKERKVFMNYNKEGEFEIKIHERENINPFELLEKLNRVQSNEKLSSKEKNKLVNKIMSKYLR